MSSWEWLFAGWSPVLKVLIAAPLMYVAVVLLVRINRKRSTSQMNNFDWIVAVSIGSMVASGIILSNVAVVTALTGVAMLFAMQWLVTWLTSRTHWAKRAVRAQPTVLFIEGQFLRENMLRERVNEEEILAALRNEGIGRLTQVHAVVLETDAKLSVLPAQDVRDFETLKGCCGVSDADSDAPDSAQPPPLVRTGKG